jgi:asparagine synthase (glutamine-hydrolysing)
MCGFAGIVNTDRNKPAEGRRIKTMIDAITHRGPDDEGIEIIGNVGLGFRRLSIVDLSNGHQPLYDAAKRACIVFNGEIYNYVEIKNQLIQRGVSFHTNSDTEVLINAYLEFGLSFVNMLRGMFAFVIYDLKKNSLVIGRDPFGIKPLYYCRTRNALHFASEIKSITSVCSDLHFNYDSMDSYFSYGFTIGKNSFYKEIERVESGQVMVFDLCNPRLESVVTQYYQPTYREDANIGFEEAVIRTQANVRAAVQRHLVSDVPVGAFLSGGIDSNIVVSQMRKLYSGDLKTFTIGFAEAEYDESRIAREAAKHYGTNHHELIVERSSSNMLEDIVSMYDEPFADSSAIPTYLVSKLASQHVKVVLSGDGGDELFGGYSSYQRMLSIARYKALINAGGWFFRQASYLWPKGVTGKRFLYNLGTPVDLQYAHHMLFDNPEKKRLFSQKTTGRIVHPAHHFKEYILSNSQSASFPSKLFELDLKVFMKDDVLVKVDRASMANSLEVRVPFIDVDLFEYAASLPWQMKLNHNTTKFILREAFKTSFPKAVYDKPKTGFTIPISKWFRDDFDDFTKDHISYLKQTGLFSPHYLDALLNMKQLGALSSRIWPLMVFAVWHRRNPNLNYD